MFPRKHESPYGLVELREAAQAGRSPARLYLAALRPSGRRSQAGALTVVSRLLTGAEDLDRCPWHLVRYEHAAAVVAALALRYKPSTTSRHLHALRGACREAWLLGAMPAEAYQRVLEIRAPSVRRMPAGRMVTADELRALWSAALPREKAAMALLFHGALRRSEAAAVVASDVSLEDGTAWVRVRDGKGGTEAEVAIRGEGARALLAWLPHAPQGPLLGTGDRGVYRLLEAARMRAHVSPCSPHDLRRSFVSHALAGGAELVAVQRAARHADPRTTSRYDRRPREALRDVADLVDDVL